MVDDTDVELVPVSELEDVLAEVVVVVVDTELVEELVLDVVVVELEDVLADVVVDAVRVDVVLVDVVLLDVVVVCDVEEVLEDVEVVVVCDVEEVLEDVDVVVDVVELVDVWLVEVVDEIV